MIVYVPVIIGSISMARKTDVVLVILVLVLITEFLSIKILYFSRKSILLKLNLNVITQDGKT